MSGAAAKIIGPIVSPPQAAPNFSTIADLIAREHFDEARAQLRALLSHPQLLPDHLLQSARFAAQVGMANAVIEAAQSLADRGADWHGLIALGMCAMNLQSYADAARLFRRATQMNVRNAGVHALFGAALYQSGEIKEARRALQKAVAIDPRNALAQHALGSFHLERGDADEALKALAIAVEADPTKAHYRVTLARAFIQNERYEEAQRLLEAALADKAAYAAAALTLGHLHRALCDNAAALRYYKQSLAAAPSPEAMTPYLFHLLASDAHSDEEVFAEHKRLGGAFDRRAARQKRHCNARDPNRRLKIGFVSGDFYQHSIANFITPLLRDLDRTRFEVFAIYNNCIQDAATAVLRKSADHFFVCHGMNDESLAAWIEARQIDILIDLSGHSKLNRLGVFGLRAAPVQTTYLGYPGTTGLSAMDYRITCESLDPGGAAEAHHTEELVRLPGLLAPFQPHGDVDVNELPHAGGAPFTFACLNPLWRINPSVMRCWGEILRATPEARMLLGNVDRPLIAGRIRAWFAAEQIDTARLDLVPTQGHRDYLKLHHRIDLALDTFPYNGGTTTTYALWMGVPVVTLEGRRTAARTGAGILREAGLDDFIARTEEDYVACALSVAHKPEPLQALRQSLRTRVRVGNTEDQRKLATEFGDALVEMWKRYCSNAAI